MPIQPIPTFADIVDAAKRLAGLAARTPLLASARLDAIAEGRVFVKAEPLQRTGSFKFRGAWSRISRLDPETCPAGVVAYSSGNHAQGVAAAARLRGLPALIVMPSDTPSIKQESTRRLGAEIVLYDRATESREAIAERICRERGAVLVPPFEDTHVIAGQGTLGLEIVEDMRARGAPIDQVLVCCSGGGLTAGIALALEELAPAAAIYSVEPEGFDDTRRSLASGRRERNAKTAGSLCDALLTPEPGETTFAINQRRLAGGLVVSEAEVRAAMRFAFEHLKVVAEPGGAVALAAVLAGKLPTKDLGTVVVVSGGNVDPAVFASVLGDPAS